MKNEEIVNKEVRKKEVIDEIITVHKGNGFKQKESEDERLYSQAVCLFGTWKKALEKAGAVDKENNIMDYYNILEEKEKEKEKNPFVNRFCQKCIWRDGLVCVANCCRKVDGWLGEQLFKVGDQVICKAENAILEEIGIGRHCKKAFKKAGTIKRINFKEKYAYVGFDSYKECSTVGIPFYLLESVE